MKTLDNITRSEAYEALKSADANNPIAVELSRLIEVYAPLAAKGGPLYVNSELEQVAAELIIQEIREVSGRNIEIKVKKVTPRPKGKQDA